MGFIMRFSSLTRTGITVYFSILALYIQAETVNVDLHKPTLFQVSLSRPEEFGATSEGLPLVLTDQESGRKAIIRLRQSLTNKTEFSGVYLVRLSEADSSTLKIQAPGKGDYLIAHIDSQKANRVVLFPNRADKEKYLEHLDQTAISTESPKAKPTGAVKKIDLAAIERAREKERQRIEQDEAARRQQLIEDQKKLAAAEIAARKKQAAEVADRANALYAQEKYIQAEELYKEASSLDPENRKFYYFYGVTLFRNQKFNKALVVFELTDGEANPVEKTYYQALCHLKTKEFDKAAGEFSAVKESNHPNLSVPSAYMAGTLRFQKGDWSTARNDFEYVIDTSDDPNMDKEAEKYIEEIDAIEAFEENKKTKFIWSIFLNPSYDSNVLNLANSTATDLAGYRLSYGGSAEYRVIYEHDHELSVIGNASDTLTTSTNFQQTSTLKNADALSVSVAVPYKIKTKAWNLPYQSTLKPSYELIYMNADQVGERENITSSAVLKWDNSFVMKGSWISAYGLEVRSDTSYLNSAAAENQSATRITLSSDQSWYLDPKKTTTFVWGLGLALNDAKGANQRYTKITTSGSYSMPFVKDWNALYRGELASANYADHSSGRKDTYISLTAGYTKALNDKWTFTGTFSVTSNDSNVSTYKYSKYTLGGTFTY
jgi:tetratricopeptide (TPR) repeat protein